MAVRQVRTCDFDLKKGPCGKDAAEREFGLDGVGYEIDLCEAHTQSLDEGLSVFLTVSRKVAGATRRGKAGAAKAKSGSGVNTSEVRAWLVEQGIEVNDRGRIPTALVTQYQEAH
jgi:hypothetical protein